MVANQPLWPVFVGAVCLRKPFGRPPDLGVLFLRIALCPAAMGRVAPVAAAFVFPVRVA